MRAGTLGVGAAVALLSGAGLAVADRAAAPAATATAAGAPSAQRHGHTVLRRAPLRARITLTLDDARLRGRGQRVVLSGRPAGRGRLVYRAPQQAIRSPRAAVLARVWRGVTGRGKRVRVALPGGRVALLAPPRMRDGRASFSARIAAGSGQRAELGAVRLAAAVPARRVDVADGCPLLPFARCVERNLRLADLHRADLRGADLRGSDLSRAFAHSARLTGADLRDTDLRGANLAGAHLRRADLRAALLADATLVGARLKDARVGGAHLCRTELSSRRLERRHCGRPHPNRHRRATAASAGGDARRAAAASTPARAARSRPRRPGPPPRAHSTAGCPYAQDADIDADGLRDCLELAGWTITVHPSTDAGTSQARTVRSRVGPADTDGDGLEDGDEYTYYGDPRAIDTDGDGLGDAAEVQRFAALPNQADTDGDARTPSGNYEPRLLDGAEASAGTSPALADTDGDALTDLAELQSPVYNPRVANLPQLVLAPDPREPTARISVGYKVTSGGSTSTQTASSSSSSTESKQSHELSVELGFESSQKFEQEGSFGVPPEAETQGLARLQGIAQPRDDQHVGEHAGERAGVQHRADGREDAGDRA